MARAVIAVLLLAAPAVAHLNEQQACEAADLKIRTQLQNKLAGACEDMCKEVGSYPQCSQCPDFVQPDATPGVMTWEELLEHMDNLSSWGHDQIKAWHQQAAGFLEKAVVNEQSCAALDLKHRAQVQNKLAGVCEDMCKEVGAYPQCSQCPDFVQPDATPGVMTWEELLEHMDNLSSWGHDQIKAWHQQAASLSQTSAVSKKCGPQTSVHVSTSKNAAGTAQFTAVDLVEGTCKAVGADNVASVKFCGPGKLVISRMTCERHDYKAHTFEHSASEWTTDCEVFSMEGTNAEGWLGSTSLTC